MPLVCTYFSFFVDVQFHLDIGARAETSVVATSSDADTAFRDIDSVASFVTSSISVTSELSTIITFVSDNPPGDSLSDFSTCSDFVPRLPGEACQT